MMFRFVMLMMLWVPPAASAAPSILVYGDSLSAAYGIANDQGWAVLLQKKLTALGYPHRVANASISGETTSGGRSRIAALSKALSIKLSSSINRTVGLDNIIALLQASEPAVAVKIPLQVRALLSQILAPYRSP